jgi:cis-3-alkyl-4-acyloxetan-2-one decarboxylase
MPAPANEQPDADWRAIYPFASYWQEIAGERLHYLDEGPVDPSESKGVLLFVHGNPTWSFHWRRLISALRSEYRCVAIDHLGCGLSHKPKSYLQLSDHIANLVALIESLNLRHVTLVAQDWGGAIGLGAALQSPERFERIVLFNTGAFPPPYIPLRIRVCRLPIVGQIAVQGFNAFSLAALRMTLARTRRLKPAVAAGYLAPYDSWSNRRGVYGFVKDIPTDSSRPTWQTLAEIEHGLPTLADRQSTLIWGMRDWCFRPDCLERLHRAWPNAQVHRLADVGHWVVEDAPGEALSFVKKFLNTGSPTLA